MGSLDDKLSGSSRCHTLLLEEHPPYERAATGGIAI